MCVNPLKVVSNCGMIVQRFTIATNHSLNADVCGKGNTLFRALMVHLWRSLMTSVPAREEPEQRWPE